VFLFWHLVLAHFIGDTILQPDEVYEIKKERFAGVVLHAVIIFFTLALFAWPYLHLWQVWLVLILAAMTHLWQDEIKIRRQTPAKYNFLFFTADQFLHIFFLTPVLLVDTAYKPPVGSNMATVLYNHIYLIYTAIVFVLTVFLWAYLWESMKISWFKDYDHYDSQRIKYGMFERSLLLVAVIFQAWWFLLVPFIFRILYKEARFSWTLVSNIMIVISAALILRLFPAVF